MTTPIEHPPITLQAHAGQSIEIALDAMPGAGLQWQLPAAPSGCTLTEAAARPGDSGSGVGGGTRQRFVLTCSGTGDHLLSFDYKRPWEAAVRARQPVRVQVR
jgi:predicted secreted protein